MFKWLWFTIPEICIVEIFVHILSVMPEIILEIYDLIEIILKIWSHSVHLARLNMILQYIVVLLTLLWSLNVKS